MLQIKIDGGLSIWFWAFRFSRLFSACWARFSSKASRPSCTVCLQTERSLIWQCTPRFLGSYPEPSYPSCRCLCNVGGVCLSDAFLGQVHHRENLFNRCKFNLQIKPRCPTSNLTDNVNSTDYKHVYG